MCLLEAAMCEKCRSSHFQSELGGVKSLRTGGLKILGLGREGYQFFLGGSYFYLGGGVSTPLYAMLSQFANMTSLSNFLAIVVFLLSSLVTGPSFMSISLLVLELRQFSFITCQEIWKKEIPSLNFSQQLETGVS